MRGHRRQRKRKQQATAAAAGDSGSSRRQRQQPATAAAAGDSGSSRSGDSCPRPRLLVFSSSLSSLTLFLRQFVFFFGFSFLLSFSVESFFPGDVTKKWMKIKTRGASPPTPLPPNGEK